MENMEIVYLSPDELTPYAKNAKQHPDEQVEHIANSIREFGFRQPIVVDADNTVVIGHGRLLAAKKLGLKEVPVVRADDLTEEQIKALRLADNKTNESEWDLMTLGTELEELALEFDMSRFGFDEMETAEVGDTAIVEDEPPEPPDEPTAKRGEIYLLGRHRLMCGDSTSAEDVSRLMDGALADLLLTDPPYNVDYEGGTGMTIMNDNMEDKAFRAFLVDAFKCADEAMKPGAAFYIWHADSEGFNFRGACREAGLRVRQCIIWNKNSFVLGRQDYQWKHEPCLYGWKDGAAHYFVDIRNIPTVMEDGVPDINKMKKEEMAALLKEIYADKVPTTVISEDKPIRSELHPTMKPIKLLARQIQNSTKQGWSILDVFGGSGSTLIACEQLNRTCYMMELDPHYVDVIIKRWEDFTGEQAVLLNA